MSADDPVFGQHIKDAIDAIKPLFKPSAPTADVVAALKQIIQISSSPSRTYTEIGAIATAALSGIPQDFIDGMRDIAEGRVVDLDTALTKPFPVTADVEKWEAEAGKIITPWEAFDVGRYKARALVQQHEQSLAQSHAPLVEALRLCDDCLARIRNAPGTTLNPVEISQQAYRAHEAVCAALGNFSRKDRQQQRRKGSK